jgi:hypothetical protein
MRKWVNPSLNEKELLWLFLVWQITAAEAEAAAAAEE